MTSISAILALAPPVQPGQEPPPLWVNLFPIIIVMVVFYFVLIRPQSKKAKEHDQLMKTLRKGDKVVTSGGILGVVVAVKDRSITLRSDDTKIEVLKSSVSEIVERSATAAEA